MRTPTHPTAPRAALALAAALTAAACSGDLGGPGLPPPPSGPGPEATPAELFAALQPAFLEACGACHTTGDTAFLDGDEPYRTVVSWPDFVIKDWENSLLLKYPVSTGAHTGTDLDSDELKDTLLPDLRAWLEAEAERLPDPAPGLPSVGPFSPILGFNAVYLTPIDPALQGVAITFNARAPAGTELELTDIEVHPTKAQGVHIVRPVFLLFPPGSSAGVEDPGDTFADLDQNYPPNQAGLLGGGQLVLQDWSEGGKLAIVFNTVEPFSGQGGTTCGALDSFTANAQALFQDNCTACHAGGDTNATAALDMSTLGADPADACAQIRNRVNPADPPSSQIFINTNPSGNASHPFKFNGDQGSFDAFQQSVTLWIAAEQQ